MAAFAKADEATSTRERRHLTLYREMQEAYEQPSLNFEGEEPIPEEWLSENRPKTRGDCLPGGCNEVRPCVWVSCRMNLMLDVDPDNGHLTEMHQDMSAAPFTCALDVADAQERGVSLDDLVPIVNLSRERLSQIEHKASAKVRDAMGGGNE